VTTPARKETRAELIAMVIAAEKVIPESVAMIENLNGAIATLMTEIKVWRQAYDAALDALRRCER
jgi:hypothetical protein